MLTTSFARRPQLRLRQIALLAGAGALVATTALVGHAVIDFQDFAADHMVEISTSYKSIPDLATLSRQSDLVIVGQVVNNGTTHFAAPLSGSPSANPAPQATQSPPGPRSGIYDSLPREPKRASRN